jgi:hypothetical protein
MHLAIAAPVLDENQEGALGVVQVALPMAPCSPRIDSNSISTK